MANKHIVTLILLSWSLAGSSQERVESNVIFGVMSGLALLTDVYYPAQPIGRAVILIPGSGWDGREVGYSSHQLKSGYPYVNDLRDSLVDEGFTVFSINHRAAPVHKYPAAVDDARRAVRFVRENADRFGIDPDLIAAIGHSSGGHLASMLGVLDDDKDHTTDNTLAASMSARVQAVVAIAAPQDLTVNTRVVAPYTVAFMGEAPPMDERFQNYIRSGIYAAASPAVHVSIDDAAFMLIYATQDEFVAVEHMEIMEEALNLAELTVELSVVDTNAHDPDLDHTAIARWLEKQLKND